jgi:hypothetical protein
MSSEKQLSHNNSTNEAAFLKNHEALLARAKEGDEEALAELKRGAEISHGRSFEQTPADLESAKKPDQGRIISEQLKPDTGGTSAAMKAETGEMTQEMLTQMISGNLDVTDPDAVTRAMIEMAKRKAEQNKN